MGVPMLNSYIKRHVSSESVRKIHFDQFAGKVIVVDISIYLYRFVGEGSLLENIYHMLSLFKHYNIISIFIFDGKAPIEKLELLERREFEKNEAKKKYYQLKDILQNTDGRNKNEILEEMQGLKKKFIRLKRIDIKNVQDLINAFGATYLIADGEADELCAELVIKNRAYACLSEDMDLFVYGCPRILRYLSLINQTFIIYYFDKVLEDLNMSKDDFQKICVISGTDYNLNSNYRDVNLFKTINYYHEFKRCTFIDSDSYSDFYSWLMNCTNYLNNHDKIDIKTILNIFSLENFNMDYTSLDLKNNKFDKEKIKEIMRQDWFIFMDDLNKYPVIS